MSSPRPPAGVLLGYELGTGAAVRLPVAHMAVTGITQESGKTTTLEALVTRSGRRAITFITKRGEGCFTTARRIPAYFRARCDWQYIEELLESYLGASVQAEREYIMRAAEQAIGLRNFAARVAWKMRHARAGKDKSAYYRLRQYLRPMLSEIRAVTGRQATASTRLDLHPGINSMDLAGYSIALQGLILASVLDHIAENETDVIVLIPEAWEFIPRAHPSPAKSAAIRLARKGACCGNYLWLDSQDLASVDIEVRKMLSIYLLGVQRENNEVKRTLAHIPKDRRRPSEAEIMQLEKGWFYASFGRALYCTYVQPTWLDADPARARRYATDILSPAYVAKPAAKSAAITKMTKPLKNKRAPAPAMSSEPAPAARTERVQ